MNKSHLTNSEQRVIETMRQMMRESNGRPFTITVQHPGGNAPIQVFKSVPVMNGVAKDK